MALAGERHPVDTARLRARRHGEASSWYGPDLGPLLAPEHETSMYTTGYTQLDHRSPPVVRAPGCWWHRRGVLSLRPAPWRSAPWGRKSAGKEGAQGWAPESFCFARPQGSPRAGFRFAKENPEGGRRPSFWVPLRGGLPVLDSCPFARLPGSLLKGHKGIGKNQCFNPGVAPTQRRAVAGRFC
jgi:hypothetical protein